MVSLCGWYERSGREIHVYANAMCMSDGWFQTQIECIFKSNVLVVCMCVCVCVQLERLTKFMLTATFVFTSQTHSASARNSKVQHGTARYNKGTTI